MAKKEKLVKRLYKRHHVHVKTVALTLIAGLISGALYMTDHGSFLYRTSVVSIPQHAEYDGTVYPIKKAPNWVKLASDKWSVPYSSLSDSDLVDFPYYDPDELAIDSASLTWGDAEDNEIRNAKITYSVPYMGSYRLNGKEYDGSHLAVDIKTPENTPVYSIANGTVIKTSTQSTGFGHHIVIQHNNFPTLDDTNATHTIYSSYNHLSELLVSEGDVVTKGEQVALSGNTGTSTTPHLHFQIDNDSAPWHPYWPFTWQESSDAGLSFTESVNEKLGYDNAIATTLNPMKYVQAYLDGSATYTTTDEGDASEETEESTETTENGNPDTSADSYIPEDSVVEDVTIEGSTTEENTDPAVLTFQFQTAGTYNADESAQFTILLKDQYGNTYSNGFTGEITVESEKGYAKPDHAILTHSDFSDEIFVDNFRDLESGHDRLVITYGGEKYYSEWFDISADEPEETAARFSDVAVTNEYYDAIMYLAEKKVISGYPDGTFQPEKTVSRVEVLKFIFEGMKEKLSKGKTPFTDVSSDEWYGNYLFTAYKKKIVNGDPDGKYRPGDTVNRAEFYKILFNSMEADINPTVKKNPFGDVNKSDWYAPYFAYAKEIGLISKNVEKVYPSGGMSRGEVAEKIYMLMEVVD